MKKTFSKFLLVIALVFSILLSGCGSTRQPEPKIEIQYKYITKTIPSEFLVIPPKVKNIDLSKSTQKDVAAWTTENSKRADELELKLNKIKALQDAPVAQ